MLSLKVALTRTTNLVVRIWPTASVKDFSLFQGFRESGQGAVAIILWWALLTTCRTVRHENRPLKMSRGRKQEGSSPTCVIFSGIKAAERREYQTSWLYAERPDVKFWRTKIETLWPSECHCFQSSGIIALTCISFIKCHRILLCIVSTMKVWKNDKMNHL